MNLTRPCSVAFILLLFSISVSAQKKRDPGKFFALNESGEATTIEKAIFLTHVVKLSDTCFQWDTYRTYGPLVKTEVYKNAEATNFNGRFIYYRANGRIDSVCRYENNYADGTWEYYNDTGKIILQKEYSRGRLKQVKDMKMLDSIFAERKADLEDSDKVESEFDGGVKAWQHYLNVNLMYPQRALNSSVKGEVVVAFEIDKEGKVQDAYIFRSVEYSLDEEALRIIRNSTKWKAAKLNGRPVRSWKRQPIIFSFN